MINWESVNRTGNKAIFVPFLGNFSLFDSATNSSFGIVDARIIGQKKKIEATTPMDVKVNWSTTPHLSKVFQNPVHNETSVFKTQAKGRFANVVGIFHKIQNNNTLKERILNTISFCPYLSMTGKKVDQMQNFTSLLSAHRNDYLK